MILLQIVELDQFSRTFGRSGGSGVTAIIILATLFVVAVIVAGIINVRRNARRDVRRDVHQDVRRNGRDNVSGAHGQANPEARLASIGARAGFASHARRLGLQPEQIRLLWKQLRLKQQWQPLRLLRDPAYMQEFSRDMMNAVRETSIKPALAEYIQFQLFQINRVVAVKADASRAGGSSRRLRTDTELHVQRPDKSTIICFVVNRTKAGLWISAPAMVEERLLEWRTGERLQVQLRSASRGNLAFASRIKRIIPDEHRHLLMISHNEQIARPRERRFPRREANIPVYFWPVIVLETGTGRKKQKQAAVSSDSRRDGELFDISGGGCSIETNKPLRQDMLLKAQFKLQQADEQVTAFGRVRHVVNGTGYRKRMAIEFTRLSRTDHNRIQSYVYDMQ